MGGSPAHERLMLANLATQLFEHGRITTTEAKAKRLRPYAEHLITFGKRGDLHARRQVLKRLNDKSVVHTLFAEIGPRYVDRPGGYTRILKLGNRKGDNAPMAIIELVEALTVGQSAVREAERARGSQIAPNKAPTGATRESAEALAAESPTAAAVAAQPGADDAAQPAADETAQPAADDDRAARGGRRHAGGDDVEADPTDERAGGRRRHRGVARGRRRARRARGGRPCVVGRPGRAGHARSPGQRVSTAPPAEPASPTGGGGLVRVRLDLAYDGTGFLGWAQQPERRTVQGTVQDALGVLLRDDPPRLQVAGRTDAGVHARGTGRPRRPAAGRRRRPPAAAPAQRAAAARRPGAAGVGRAGRLRRPLLRPVAHVPLPGRRRPRARRPAAPARRADLAPARPGAAARRPARRCWASTTSPPSAVAGRVRRPCARCSSCGWGAVGRRAARPHGARRRVLPLDGALAGRGDARRR